MLKKSLALTAATSAALLFTAIPAQAVVVQDPSCSLSPSNATGACGFIGKGDVQAVLGWNNAQLQANAGRLSFTSAQSATQAVTQSATQSATQAGTQTATQTVTQTATQSGEQSVTETLSCVVDNKLKTVQVRNGHRLGDRSGNRTGTATGTRTATRERTRTGQRVGSRAGVQTGSYGYTIAYDSRTRNQITGFFLTGISPLAFTATADPVWQEATFGDWAFGDYHFGDYAWGGYSFGDYTLGEYTWGDATWTTDWTSLPSENPEGVCLGNPNATDITDVVSAVSITDGDVAPGAVSDPVTVEAPVVDGAVVAGPVAWGPIVAGAVTATGPAHVYVNGVLLA